MPVLLSEVVGLSTINIRQNSHFGQKWLEFREDPVSLSYISTMTVIAGSGQCFSKPRPACPMPSAHGGGQTPIKQCR